MRIQIDKLVLKEGQIVKVTEDMLEKLPSNKYSAPATVKMESAHDINQDSQSSTSTILYSWADHIPEHYLKPKFKVTASLKLPKLKEVQDPMSDYMALKHASQNTG